MDAYVRDLLCKVPLFHSLSPADAYLLAAMMHEKHVGKGEVLFRCGDEGSSLYIVSSGMVKIAVTSVEGEEKILALMGPGDFFGEMSLLDGRPRSADAIALKQSHLYVMHRKQLKSFLRSHPDACLSSLAALSLRLRQTDELIEDALFLDIPKRLAKVILQLAEISGECGQSSIDISLRMSQTELAALVGATRESVNKCLRQYQGLGLLLFDRGRITVLNPEKLKSLCSTEDF